MLIVKEDKNRPEGEGRIFVQLKDRVELDDKEYNSLGYWCDKPHLRHFLLEIARVFSTQELEEILNYKIVRK